MNRHIRIYLIAVGLVIAGWIAGAQRAQADCLISDLCGCDCCAGCVCGDCGGCCCCDCGYMFPVLRSRCYNWNGRYANSNYGQPVALVIPPTVNMQTNWGWGVGSSRISHMDHQVQRNYPGPGPFGGGACGNGWRRTPMWPSDTTQFGVYYVRGPW